MNLAHLVGVNSRDWDRFDPVTFTAGDDEHFSLVLEPVSAAKQLWNQLSIYHAETALRIRNLLSAEAANLAAHITIHNAPD